MICRQQLICFTPCEYKIRQDLPYPMLFLLHGGKWRSDGCNLLPLPSSFPVFKAKLHIVLYATKFLKGIGGYCPVFAMPERPRITTKSAEYTIYALSSVYAVPTFMSCKSRPTYVRTYRWKDYWTDRPRDGLPSFTQDGHTYLFIYT